MKGIELTTSGQNPKTITQAVNQLSYAMVEMINDSMLHQYEKLLSTSDFIFYNVPIIVTTANLYRLRENITIDKIKSSDEISELATKEDYLVLETKLERTYCYLQTLLTGDRETGRKSPPKLNRGPLAIIIFLENEN